MPPEREPRTSVVVVSADSGPLLIDCARAVLETNDPLELIVVDNASEDGAVDLLLDRFGSDARLNLIRNRENIGFGSACNQAARVASGTHLLFLNPDCVIEPGAIGALESMSLAHPEVGLFGIEILDVDGVPAGANRRREPTLRRAIATLRARLRSRSAGIDEECIEMVRAESHLPLEPVDAVSGACMFVSKANFEIVGGFDEAYFLHVEDLDLCRRIRSLGLRVAVANSVRATHRQGSSSRHRPVFVAWHKHRGMWRYFRTHDAAARNPLIRILVRIAIWGHFAIDAAHGAASHVASRAARSAKTPPDRSGGAR